MAEFVCIKKCFFNSALYNEGDVVTVPNKELENNPCFKRLHPEPAPEQKKSVKKTEEQEKLAVEDTLSKV